MANRYWVGADGNWSDTNKWATTSGGTPGASVPGAADTAIFDANSNTGTTAWTATVDTAFTITTLTVTGIDAQLTLASAGNLTCSTSTSITAGTQTVLLGGNASLGAVSLVTGTLNINGSSITVITLTSNNASGSRTVNFGTNGTVNVTGNNATVWSVTASGTSTVSGTGTVNLTYSGATGTRTISNLPDTSSSIDFNVTAGTDTVSFSTSLGVKSLSFSGFSGTWTNTALSIAGGLTVSSGMTVGTGTNAVTFTATSGTNTITTNNKTLDFPVTFNGAGGTFQLQDNCTIGATRTTTLTAGTIDLTGNSGNWTLSTGLFAPTGTGVRSIIFGTGKIQLSATTTSTVWSGATLTNFSYTGTPLVELTGNASAVTRTINHGATAGVTESNAVNFSVTAGSDTVTITAASDVKDLTFTGFSGTWTNTAITLFGNLIAATGMTVGTGTNAVTFGATSGTQTIDSAGKTFDFPVTFDGAGTKQLVTNNLTVGSTRTTTLTAGTLDLNSLTLSTGLFASSNSNTRAIAFGTGQISLTSTGTIWDMATATNFTYTGTPSVVATASGFVNKTMNHGSTAGGTESNAVSMAISAATGIATIAGFIKNLDFTGYAGPLANSTRTIYGNTIISTGMTLTSGTLTTTFGATSGTQTINSAGKTFDFPVTFDGAGTKQLVTNNLTVGSTRTTTLTAGTLDLVAQTLSTGLFSSTGTTARAITRTSGNITVTGNAATVVTLTGSNATYGSGLTISANYSGGTGTRTFNTTESGVGVSITAGTDTVVFTASNSVGALNFTGFSGTWTNVAMSIYGSLTVSTGMTVSAGANAVTFAGTGTLTSNGKTLDFPVAINAPSATVTLGGALTLGSTPTLTLTAGTFDAVTYNVTAATFVSTNSNVRTLALGSGTWTITSGSSTTGWACQTSTNLTVTGTATISMTSATTKAFRGGGLTWPTLRNAGAGQLNIDGNNTFTTITNSVQPTTFSFTAGTTQTVTNFTVNGTLGSLVTINSSSAGTQATLFKASGRVDVSYLSIQDSNATGGATWYALLENNNVNNGNNTGWNFVGGASNFMMFFV